MGPANRSPGSGGVGLTYQFRKAVREQVNLIVALAGGTGSGKTMSALRLAAGMAKGKPFCVLDTENGRASHYADLFSFDVCDLKAPFRPEAYEGAITAADKAGYPVIIVDSMSHEHAGEGGLLDWHEEELTRLAKDDWQRREACKMTAWIKPKGAHKHMMNTLLQVRAHLILCFRAEEKIEMVRTESGKLEVRAKVTPTGKDGWVPICEKNIPYEATCSFLLLATAPGLPHPIKLQAQHRAFFEATTPIEEQSGAALAEWAAGGASTPAPALAMATPTPAMAPEPAAPGQTPYGDHLSVIDAATTIATRSVAVNQALDDLRLTATQHASIRQDFADWMKRQQPATKAKR